MTAKTYAKFTENNEWEGETWHFYIPIGGNEEALQVLLTALDEVDTEPYELDLDPIPESEVDTLVKHGGDTTYLEAHHKLAGTLTLNDEVLAQLKDKHADPFYKGEIRTYVRETQEATG